MRYSFLFILCLFISLSCNKETFFNGPNNYQDDFENYMAFEDLFEEDDEFWSFSQMTRDENRISVDTLMSYSGNKSMKFYATNSDQGNSSKSSIVKQKMSFWENETIHISAWYFLEGTDDLEWLFLLDLEEQTAIGAGPGMRLALVDNKLRIEFKFLETDIIQTQNMEVDFPRDKWVKIDWEVGLSTNNNGMTKLWQDNELIIEKDEIRTLPKDFLYAQQGTKGMYSSVEVGITANSNDNDLTLWVDDVNVELVE